MSHQDSHPDVEELKRELDRRADRDDAFWQTQRQAIQRRLRQTSSPVRPVRTPRPIWALAGLGTVAAGAVVAAALLLAPVLVPDDSASPGIETPAQQATAVDPDTVDPDTAELLRSVETTLASDVSSPLAAADVLLAQMEAEYALWQTQSEP